MTDKVVLSELITDVAMGPFGSNLKKDNFMDSGIPVIRGGNLYEAEVGGEFVFVSEKKAQSLKRSLAYPDDIVITHRGTLGQVSIVPHGVYPYYLASQSQLRLTPNKERVNPRYLLYYLRSDMGQHEIMQHTSQVGVPSIATPTKAVKSFKIALPSLADQKRIVEVLGAIDQKIKLNLKMNETLEQMAQALFREYFIENSEAPEWANMTLGELFDITMGQSPPGSSYNVDNNGMTFYQGRAEFGSRFPQKRLSTIKPMRMAKHGDVLLSVRAPVGDINQANEDCCIGRGLAAIHSNEGLESFCYYYMKRLRPIFAEYNLEGTVFGAINGKQLKGLSVIAPPAELRQSFNQVAQELDEQIWNNSNQIQALNTLRNSLLPRLISGKIKA